MPGFTTHYLFGLVAYHALPHDSLRDCIYRHHAAYSLGLQGPDLFFHYLPSYALHRRNIGSIAHTEETGAFLANLLESRGQFDSEEEADIATAYVLGFLGHYLLDCRCHPYIYGRTHYKGDAPGYYGTHVYLETDIDTELLYIFKRCKPSAFRPEATIALTRLERHTIAKVLHDTYQETYPDLQVSRTVMNQSIHAMQINLRLLNDPHGKRKIVVRKFESLFGVHPFLSPMISSDYLLFFADPLNKQHQEWHNPWDANHSSTESFLDLFRSARKEYVQLMEDAYGLFCAEPQSDDAKVLESKVLNALGNYSYHSGLEPGMELPI